MAGSVNRTISREVAARLRDDILSGVLAPGTRLRQLQLAADFEVSTTPIREALVLLAADGLVVLDAHRGATVFRPSLDELVEAVEVRELLEEHAVRKAVGNLGTRELDALEALVEEMEATASIDEWVELNDRFHLIIYEAAGNSRLVATIEGLREASSTYLRLYASSAAPGARGDDDHRRILEHCRAGDVEGAAAATRAHVRETADALASIIPPDSREEPDR
jgi:DNA-binding GntR family transcriptional regulator